MVIEYRETASGSRVGADGKLKFNAALDMIQDCECEGVFSEKAFWGYFEARGMAMFIASRAVTIERIPEYREQLTVRTFPYANGSGLGYRYTEIIDSDGGICLSCHTIAAFVERSTGTPMRVPRELAAAVELREPPNRPFGGRRIVPCGEPFGTTAVIPVKRGDIDVNNHVNNVKYVEAALELLPQNFAFTKFRVEYKSPAKLGDTMYAEVLRSDCAYYNRMSGADGKIYTLMEFAE